MKKIYIVPNFVTTLGMFAGFFSIVSSFSYDFQLACWAIIFAGIFDVLDGRIARLARATSSFGVEYDSLSDLISFGAAPAVLVYAWGLDSFGRLGWLISFLFLACGALRLARFNVSAAVLSKAYFQGLPIPVAALMVITFIMFNNSTQWPTPAGERPAQILMLGLVLLNALLMVSSIPFASFKEVNWRSRASSGYIIIFLAALILVAIRPEIVSFLILFTYVIVSLTITVYKLFSKRRGKEVV